MFSLALLPLVSGGLVLAKPSTIQGDDGDFNMDNIILQ